MARQAGGSFSLEEPGLIVEAPPATWFQTHATGSAIFTFDRQDKDHENAPIKMGKTTTLQATSTLVTTVIGAGILAFPSTFAAGGWVFSPIILVTCALAATEVGTCINSAASFIEDRIAQGDVFTFQKPQRYHDLCEGAFGQCGRSFCGVFLNGQILMLGGAFIILITNSLVLLFGWTDQEQQDNRTYVILGVATLFAPISLLDDMTVIAKMSFVGVIASIIYAITIGFAGIQASGFDVERKYTVLLPVEELHNLGAVISVMLLGFGYQFVAPSVRAEMQEPNDLPKAIGGALFISGSVYGFAGALAYYGWGNAVTGNVNDSMFYPDGSKMLTGTILSAAIVGNLLVTFPILMNVVYRATETGFGVKYSAPIRLFLLTIALLIGLFLPFFFIFLTLVGSIMAVPVGIYFPIAMFWKLAIQAGSGPREQPGKLARHIFILIVGVTAQAFGGYKAVSNLIAELS